MKMRYYLIKLPITALLIMSIITLLISGAVATTALQHGLNDLMADNYYILSWKSFPNNKTSLLLLYDEGSPSFKSYYAYAELDNSGDFVVGPDSISGSLLMYDNAAFFDDEGRFYMYDTRNSGMVRLSSLRRVSYDPYLGQIEFKDYNPQHYWRIFGGVHVSGVGNVLLARGSGKNIPRYGLIIEDPQADSFDIIPVDLPKMYLAPTEEFCAYKLSKNRILVIGLAFDSPDGLDTFSIVSSLVYNLSDKQLIHSQHVFFDSLVSVGTIEFESVGPSQIFEKDGDLYYLAVGKNVQGRMRRSLIVPFDGDGKIKTDVQALQLNVEYQSLDSAPEQFLLLRAPEQSGKFWMMSLDTFPTIVIDKGE